LSFLVLLVVSGVLVRLRGRAVVSYQEVAAGELEGEQVVHDGLLLGDEWDWLLRLSRRFRSSGRNGVDEKSPA
jgi:hypothetical protein